MVTMTHQEAKDVWERAVRHVRLNKYILHDPTPKQRAFLALPHREAFYGGAAGGGKSDALLMGALQWVDIPDYSAIIFRRKLTDLKKADSLIPRSIAWLKHTDADWNGQDHVWTFPSGATLEFGYLRAEMDRFNYDSAAYQYIAFDEVTTFPQDDYVFLFNRLRRKRGNPVPLRMRAASNPGGVGHLWVKKRFDIGQVTGADGVKRWIGRSPRTRPFIPARLADNPYLESEEYAETLAFLDPVTRAQRLAGNWDARADGRFQRDWCRWFSVRGEYFILGPGGRGEPIHKDKCDIFQVVDPAASSQTGPADVRRADYAPSWTVIGTFARVIRTNDLLWIKNRRIRKEIPEVCRAIQAEAKDQQPSRILIERDGLGVGVYQTCSRMGLPVRPILTKSKDKLVRATDAINRMEHGQIWLPDDEPPWLEDCEDELWSWTAHPHEQDDQVDTLAHAAREVSRVAISRPPERPGSVRVGPGLV